MVYVPLRKRYSRDRGGPSRVPVLFKWRGKKPLISRLHNPIAHQSRRIEYADMAISRGGPSRVPALTEWWVKKPLVSRLPNPIAHQSGRIEYADMAISQGGLSRAPGLFKRRVKKPFISRLPNPIAHQSGRIEYADTAISRGGPPRVPALSERRVKKPLYFEAGQSYCSSEWENRVCRHGHISRWPIPCSGIVRAAGKETSYLGAAQSYCPSEWENRVRRPGDILRWPVPCPALSERRVKKPLISRLPNPIAHQSGRIEYADTAISRGGRSRVPALSEWRVKKPLISRLPNPIAHQSGRIEHADMAISRGGPSRVPALFERRVKKPLISRLPNPIAHQSGRVEYADSAISQGGPSHVPALSEWRVKKPLISRLPNPIAHQSGRIEYADTAISRWLAVGLDDDGDHLPSSGFLKTVSVESVGLLPGEEQLAIAKSCVANEDDETGRDHRKKPWVHIAETVMQDLVRSFEVLRSAIKDQSMGEIKPTLIARFGKILFRGSPSFPVETCRDMVTKASLKRLKRSFYSNLPSFYMENVTHKVIPEIGLSFEDEKDIYHVKLCDNSMPGVTICCKCNVIMAEQRLEIYKVELGQVRQMVVDVSCLNKDLDLRLMLRAKRLYATISEDEKNSISDLITSAVLDSTVKGGLRWPLRKAFSRDRYRVIGAWHTVSTTYNNSSMRLKVKHADRFDFRHSQGQVTEEITLKLNGITSELHGQSLGTDSVSDMLKDAVKMMWEHFLSCGNTVI